MKAVSKNRQTVLKPVDFAATLVNVEDMQNSFDAKAWQENETDKSEIGK